MLNRNYVTLLASLTFTKLRVAIKLRPPLERPILSRVSNIYLHLTDEFNRNRLRAIISSGQAVVLHRLAVMSKDGDWILREDDETMQHVLDVLTKHKAHYRFGAPLDPRWMSGGWSAHFEFRHQQIRVRTDFVTRPPRVDSQRLAQLWERVDPTQPVVDVATLANIKKSNREKDYAVIGELARLLSEARDQLLHSRSARDLITLASTHNDLINELASERPLLKVIFEGQTRLEQALDAERRDLIHANEDRLCRYRAAAQHWAEAWPEIEKEIGTQPLPAAHSLVVRRALEFLPFVP